MGNFNKNYRPNRGDQGGSFRRRSFGDRDSGRSEMHDAICAECGKPCKVPFFPSGDRPVYCSDCFEKRSNRDERPRESDRRNFDRPRFEERRMPPPSPALNEKLLEQLTSINGKLDSILSALKPQDKPVAIKKEKVSKKVSA